MNIFFVIETISFFRNFVIEISEEIVQAYISEVKNKLKSITIDAIFLIFLDIFKYLEWVSISLYDVILYFISIFTTMNNKEFRNSTKNND